MIETIAGIFVVLFCVLGVVGAIKWLMLRVAAPCSDDKRIYAVLLTGDSADIELQMAVDTVNWDSGLLNARAYAIDCGISKECYTACFNLCKSTRFRLVTVEEFERILSDYNK